MVVRIHHREPKRKLTMLEEWRIIKAELAKTLTFVHTGDSPYQDTNDFVSWTGKYPGEDKITENYLEGSACYYRIMSKLGNVEIYCQPFSRGFGFSYTDCTLKKKKELPPEEKARLIKESRLSNRLSKDQYLQLAQVWTDAKIAPEGVIFEHSPELGNCMTIPSKGWDRHTVYILLCFYRWMDHNPTLVWGAHLLREKLREQGKNLTYLQVMFYLLVQEGTCNSNHSFFGYNMLKRVESGKGKAKVSKTYLYAPLGWAWANWYTLGRKGKCEFETSANTDSTLMTMAKAVGGEGQTYQFIAEESFLSPKLDPLFSQPENFRDPEVFQKFMLSTGLEMLEESEDNKKIKKSSGFV